MRRYEVVFVLAPTMTDEEVDQLVESYSTVAQEVGAEVVQVDKWGKRRLAFPVQKHNEGYYTVLTLEEDAAKSVAELERRFKVNDSVIRFLSVRIDQELKRAERFETKRERRKARKLKARVAAAAEESSVGASESAEESGESDDAGQE
ncbi:MAG: 30S ribosomal protein S6 [Acidobacteriota bacterium]|jgi:small subunit ribosomal protein S6